MRIIGQTHHYLVSVLGSRWRKVNLAMATLYIDDSGRRNTHKIAIATVLVVPGNRVTQLEIEWSKFKENKKFSCFHASPCNARDKKSEFAEFKEKKINEIFSGVRKISIKYGLEAICAAVLKKDYDEVVPESFKRYTGKYHYTWCASYAIAFMKKKGVEKNKPCEYIFDYMDAGDPVKIEIEKMMEYSHRAAIETGIFSDYRNRAFRERCQTPGLQCVDEIAWTCNQYALKRLGIRDYIPRRARNSWNHYGGEDGPDGWLKAFTFSRSALRKYVRNEISDGRTLARFDRWEREDNEKKI